MTWWKKGVRFECQGSGKCCVSRGQYGFVYTNLEERRALAKKLHMTTSAFTRTYCTKEDGYYVLKEEKNSPDCIFLKEKRCSVYEARPTQCKTWPFWPEVMNAKTWSREVASYCPGVGKGKLWSADEIQQALDEQRSADLD